MSCKTFEFVCSLYFSSEMCDEWRSPGGRIEDYAEVWTRNVAESDELTATVKAIAEFLDTKPTEKGCHNFLATNGADLGRLDTRDLSLIAFLEFWLRLAKQQLDSHE